jgi:hypothetical protein
VVQLLQFASVASTASSSLSSLYVFLFLFLFLWLLLMGRMSGGGVATHFFQVLGEGSHRVGHNKDHSMAR